MSWAVETNVRSYGDGEHGRKGGSSRGRLMRGDKRGSGHCVWAGKDKK